MVPTLHKERQDGPFLKMQEDGVIHDSRYTILRETVRGKLFVLLSVCSDLALHQRFPDKIKPVLTN
jgi:hypothetical protein